VLRRPRRAALEASPSIQPATPTLSVERPLASYEPVRTADACGFARRFALDYLSWDEDAPGRRAAALAQYLADADMAQGLGWSGDGRQRADEAVTGRTVQFHGAVIVEITARVTPYYRTDTAPETWQQPTVETPPPLAIAPSSAPPASAPGWEPGPAWWVPLAPPVRRDHTGRLVIDLALDPSALAD
jgi:hypothetical protein